MIKIYHNPRCSKSRQALQLVNERSEEVEVIEYLKNPPTVDELKVIVRKLNIRPQELIRKGESIFKTNFKGKELSDDQWIQAMVDQPILIERPIIVKGDKAVIGRPPGEVNQL